MERQFKCVFFRFYQNLTQRAQLESFIQGCKAYGLKDQEVFQVNDLYEKKNIPQFTQCIVSLGRLVSTNVSQ